MVSRSFWGCCSLLRRYYNSVKDYRVSLIRAFVRWLEKIRFGPLLFFLLLTAFVGVLVQQYALQLVFLRDRFSDPGLIFRHQGLIL